MRKQTIGGDIGKDIDGGTSGGISGGMTIPQGAALTIGAVLGTGVISLPSIAAGIAGPASLVAWIALVLLSAPLAGTFAALGARYPDAGGVATYVSRAFGDRASTVVGWCFWFAIPLGAPPAAMFAGGYVADAFGGGRTTEVATAAVLVVGVAAMNAFGVRLSGKVQLAATSVLGLLLLVTAAAALPRADLGNLAPFAPHGWMAVGSAAAVLVWAFAGWEAVTSLTSEYRDPRRGVPRATAIAVVVVGALYLGVVLASLLVLGAAASTSRAPLADLLAIAFGEPARAVTTGIALLLTVGTMNAYFAGSAKLGAALGRDGSLPAWLGRGSARGAVPRRSLGVVAGLAVLTLSGMAVFGVDVATLVLLVTGSFTLVYALGTAAAIRLLPARSLARAAAWISLVTAIGLLLLTGTHLVFGLGVAVAALGYRAWSRRRAVRAGTEVPPVDSRAHREPAPAHER
ncbi:MAG TPA: amino acid permease [Actinopolymorphaceae bacterium]